MKLQDFKYIYFLGVGGIGMSAIARWFVANGFWVAGYDKTPTPLTEVLQREGILVHFDDRAEAIPAEVLLHPQQTLVIRTPAVPGTHAGYQFLEKEGYTIQKRSQVLGLLTENLYTIAVAGTHGKTTTSSMIAHVLKNAQRNVTAFLGGITQNYETNFLINEGPDQVICVVEADEFDRSFLTLFPDVCIVTSTDADHLDIYGDHGHLLESFSLFVKQIKSGGKFFMQYNLELADQTNAATATFGTFGGDYQAVGLHIDAGRFVFDAATPQGTIEGIRLMMPGFHNVENSLACVAACLQVGLSFDEIRDGLNSYRGVKRRFEYHIERPDLVYIDDYAHHPTEISAFLTSVKALYPTRPLTCIFQPHLYTRTRDFQEGFAESLSLADSLILLDIYPARELPIEGVTSALILDKVSIEDKILCQKDQVLGILRNREVSLVVTVGAGDIDTLIEPLNNFFRD
jgi:UDP-N-acetylmuramate--alanine ligase